MFKDNHLQIIYSMKVISYCKNSLRNRTFNLLFQKLKIKLKILNIYYKMVIEYFDP
jgi:hypothetical protein